MRIILFFFIYLFYIPIKAQDRLLSLIELDDSEHITSTFKGTKIVNGQSVELTSNGVLHFEIQHRFGTLNSGFYNLFGLDNSQVRLGFVYGLKDWFNIGIGRSSLIKTIDLTAKVRLKQQTQGINSFPFTIATNSSMFIKQFRASDIKEKSFLLSNQLIYSHQLLIACKISRGFSLQISPTFIHYNIVNNTELNDRVSLGFGARKKLNNRVSVNGEYFMQHNNDIFRDVLSFGFDIETGGHVFQLHLSNSSGMIEPSFIHNTNGSWLHGDIYFGFNISRVFTIREN